MNTPLFFESAGDERSTPKAFFDALNAEFHFDIDCAASKLNHKCDLYFGEGGVENDAIEADWAGMTCFLNPPYSVAGGFVAKAREEADKGATVVLLLPVRSDTKWWHHYIYDKSVGPDGAWYLGVRARFIPGRLNFELVVPVDMRAWITSELKASIGSINEEDFKAKIKSLVQITGLPKMAIERIFQDLPDEDLMEAAPFPSCVIIFTKS